MPPPKLRGAFGGLGGEPLVGPDWEVKLRWVGRGTSGGPRGVGSGGGCGRVGGRAP